MNCVLWPAADHYNCDSWTEREEAVTVMSHPPPHAEFRPGDQVSANQEWKARCEDYEKVQRYNRLSASYARKQERLDEEAAAAAAAAADPGHGHEAGRQPQLTDNAYESDDDGIFEREDVFQEEDDQGRNWPDNDDEQEAPAEELFVTTVAKTGGAAGGPDIIDEVLGIGQNIQMLAKRGLQSTRRSTRNLLRGKQTTLRNLNYALNQDRARSKLKTYQNQKYNICRKSNLKSKSTCHTLVCNPEEFAQICEATDRMFSDGKVNTCLGVLHLQTSVQGIDDNSWVTVVNANLIFSPEPGVVNLMAEENRSDYEYRAGIHWYVTKCKICLQSSSRAEILVTVYLLALYEELKATGKTPELCNKLEASYKEFARIDLPGSCEEPKRNPSSLGQLRMEICTKD